MSKEAPMPLFEFNQGSPEVVMFDLLRDAEARLRQGVGRDHHLLDGATPGYTENEYGTYDVFERYVTTGRDGRSGIKYGIFHLTEDYSALLHGEPTTNWRVEVPITDHDKIPTRLDRPDAAHLRVATNRGRLIDTREISLETVDELVLAKSALFAKLPEILSDSASYRLIPGK
jgi:hypothetical protein